jgi:glutamine synthetase
MVTREDVLQAIEEHQVKFVVLWFTDITGIVKTVTIPVLRVEHIMDHGLMFDGSSIEGFARIAESDMVLKPDLDTFIILPWEDAENRTARLICSVCTPQGDLFIGDPRNALRRVLQNAAEMGFTFKTGVELEFFLFQADKEKPRLPLMPHDESSYFDISNDFSHNIRRKMISTLLAMGIRVDSTHHEIGAGQHELILDYSDALRCADEILTARVALRTIAQRNNLYCTFMPRPSMLLPGSGMHTHQSLHNVQSDANVFVDATHEYGLSALARYFLAGQLAHTRAMCAVLAPLVNSYKRIGVSFEAPVYVAWGHVNRGGLAVFRVPHIVEGREAHTRLEMRCPDPSANPYLAFAVMLAAGLDGIEQRMNLPDAMEESLVRPDRSKLRQRQTVPFSLGEALEALQQDDVIMGALGPYISDRYVDAKRQELEEYNRQVTDWELNRYIARF